MNSLLKVDLDTLEEIINRRLLELSKAADSYKELSLVEPSLYKNDHYAAIAGKLNTEERLTLVLALASYFAPEKLDNLYYSNPELKNNFSQIGGQPSKNSSAFLPTGDTARFLCCGNSYEKKIKFQEIFDADQPLYRYNLLKLLATPEGDPPLFGRIVPTEECLQFIRNGKEFKPTYNSNFPAQLLDTPLEWEDLVLPFDSMDGLNELDAWLGHHQDLDNMPHISKKFKRGYRALFHGPSGTGKTLTASLLSKKYNLDIYHIDLSMMVSKYIGETEKNLKNVFDIAENKGWILFFDEADALFGKRTATQSSNDRYANQEISYLLQRIEDYPGLIVLASNFKTNMDKAFLRRFQSIVYFPIPGAEERLQLWQKAFNEGFTLEKAIDLKQIAKEYEMTGASIGNVLRFATLMALKRKSTMILEEELIEGIRRELAKEGKII